MGVAIDSFVMVVEISGTIATLALIWSLFTRLRARPGKRNIFQRFPVLLPAVAFVVSFIIILQLGILPISQYKGTSYLNTSATSGDILRFNVYESGIVYAENVELIVDMYLVPGESINNTIQFYLLDNLVETVNINLTSTGVEEVVTEHRLLDLNPGLYFVRVNNTFYDHGIPDDMAHWVGLRLSQSVKASFLPEIVTWSSIQFGLNVGCFFFILGGFCVGGDGKRRYPIDETANEPQTEYSDGGPDYGKGC
jgi:hypothetical protein